MLVQDADKTGSSTQTYANGRRGVRISADADTNKKKENRVQDLGNARLKRWVVREYGGGKAEQNHV